MKSIARPVVLVLLTLLVAAPLLAQAWKGSGRIQGLVVDPGGKPYAGAKVTLRRTGDAESGPEPLLSDKKGRWSYLGLAGGQWTVLIETEEYLASEGTVTIRERGGPGQPLEVRLQAPSSAEPRNVVANLIERGNAHLQAGRFAEARGAYEEAMATIDPASKPSLLRGIAQTWIQEEENGKALELLEQSLELAPDDAVTLKLLIGVLLAEGRDEEAEPLIARLPEGEKLDTASRLNMGIELYNQDDLDGALVHFEQAIADFPEDPEGYYYRGLTFLGQQRSAEAAADLKKVVELAPGSAKAEEARQFLEYLEGQ